MNKFETTVESATRALLGIIPVKISEEKLQGIVQFVKFGIVGASNTVISYVINVLVLLLLKPLNVPWDYIAGNTVAFILSVLWSFYWNNKYVFTVKEGESRNIGRALLKTYISYGFTGIVLNNILSYVWINVLGISKYVAPIINLVISVPLNYIINKLWAFKN